MTTSPAPTPDTKTATVTGSSILDTPVPHIDIHEDEITMLLDGSRSMSEPVAPHKFMTKWQYAQAAISACAGAFQAMDSQAADEGKNAKSGEHNEEAGGIMTIVFQDGTYYDMDDVNPDNAAEKFAAVTPNGSTYLWPAIERGIALYREEFGHAAIKPHWDVLGITDGELSSEEDFNTVANWLSSVTRDVTVAIAVIGSDDASQQAIDQWTAISKRHPNVIVKSFYGSSNPADLSNWLVGQFK